MQVDIADFLETNHALVKKIAVNEGRVICHEGQTCADLVVLTSGVRGNSVCVLRPSQGTSG